MWLILAWLAPSLLPAAQRLSQYLMSNFMPKSFAPPVKTGGAWFFLGWCLIAIASSIFIAWDLHRHKSKARAADCIAFFSVGIFCV
jgi:hypothetical protein